jgi:hypothetical protein
MDRSSDARLEPAFYTAKAPASQGLSVWASEELNLGPHVIRQATRGSKSALFA